MVKLLLVLHLQKQKSKKIYMTRSARFLVKKALISIRALLLPLLLVEATMKNMSVFVL